MITTYFNYSTQKWCYDVEGFLKFHLNELDFLTSLPDCKTLYKDEIKHHVAMVNQAGAGNQLSDFLTSL